MARQARGGGGDDSLGAPGGRSRWPPGAQAGAGAQGGQGQRGGAAAGGSDRANWDAPYIISPHSPTRLYWASNKLYRSGRPRRHVGGRERRSLAQPEARGDPDHGQGVAARLGRAQRLDDRAQQHRVARRVAAARGAHLRRHRRRAGAGDRGRREELAQGGAVPRRAAVDVRERRVRVAARRQHRVRRRSTTGSAATTSRTS